MRTNTRYPKTPFEVKGWEREEHFHFFKSFANPFFNVHTEIEITNLYNHCKQNNLSVFLAYMHTATEAARKTENFLLRLEGEEVVRYAAADISTTVLTERKTVSFVHLPHHPDLATFCTEASAVVAEAKQGSRLFYGYNGPDLLHATTLPWFKFNGMEHAHMDDPNDAIPKLAFGRLEVQEAKVVLPLSVRVHHALVDGYHIHLFLQHMEASIKALA
ncbi:CatA-like O-acetyltransferase [Pontibacter litorisediminis]|uniref:CatA-like O-acetyltransferase n=1 Tax=Pontibacter litorisediminis TaxID=1846260 RepID=UPI0023ED78BD|nr:CatA-like O-acetyltransferase [Pontibacter litorisediminis]